MVGRETAPPLSAGLSCYHILQSCSLKLPFYTLGWEIQQPTRYDLPPQRCAGLWWAPESQPSSPYAHLPWKADGWRVRSAEGITATCHPSVKPCWQLTPMLRYQAECVVMLCQCSACKFTVISRLLYYITATLVFPKIHMQLYVYFLKGLLPTHASF